MLSAAGLAVAGTRFCIPKYDNWISRMESLRVCIPGESKIKLEDADALCVVGHWEYEQRDDVDGWRLGVDIELRDKRKRHSLAINAADAR